MENTLKNNKRKFDYNNYKEWDNVAKLAVRSYLERLGCELFPEVESYDADIMVVQPIKSYHEVEVKLGWKEEWPSSWKTVHIPYRKKRLIDMMKNKDELTFYILRKDLKQAWTIKGSECKNEVVAEVPNKFKAKGELFFNIPIKNATLINLR